MSKIKYYKICIDGIDKTGKDTIKKYVYTLTKGKYLVYDRGIISQIAYSELFNRNHKYNICEKDTINIYLTVNKEDWDIRCKLTNEPSIDYETHINVFNKIAKKINPVFVFNTSDETPYNIAKQIVKIVEELNNEN